jgi:hypothetical protein
MGALASRKAQATLLRGLSLPMLAQGSDHIVLGTALDASAHYETIGGRRRIVTDTRVRLDDVVAKSAPADSELLVRTLGGTVGEIAALVFGEAQLNLGEPCLLFLVNGADAVRHVHGMAQGHYPMQLDAKRVMRLFASPRTPELTPNAAPLAVQRLVGQTVADARVLVREALKQ